MLFYMREETTVAPGDEVRGKVRRSVSAMGSRALDISIELTVTTQPARCGGGSGWSLP